MTSEDIGNWISSGLPEPPEREEPCQHSFAPDTDFCCLCNATMVDIIADLRTENERLLDREVIWLTEQVRWKQALAAAEARAERYRGFIADRICPIHQETDIWCFDGECNEARAALAEPGSEP